MFSFLNLKWNVKLFEAKRKNYSAKLWQLVPIDRIGTNQIMGSIQLGIQQAVGSLASKPELDVLIQDFYDVETIPFAPNGSETTPAHGFSEFRCVVVEK